MKAIFLGRFQPFHKGHEKVVSEYKEKYNDFVIVVGSPEKFRTCSNPLTLEERKDLISSCFPNIAILSVEDEDNGEEGHEKWRERLMEKTSLDVIITANPLVREIMEKGSVEVVENQLYNPERYSGTEIRKRISTDEDWRHLVPDCNLEKVESYEEIIKNSFNDSN